MKTKKLFCGYAGCKTSLAGATKCLKCRKSIQCPKCGRCLYCSGDFAKS